jgi:membrane protein required for colicin V production
MNYFDYAVLGVLALSLLWSLLRGLVREIVSLAGWIAAFVLSAVFGDALAQHMPAEMGAFLASLVGYLAVFILVLVASGLVGLVCNKLIAAAGLGMADRALGALFGLVRGLILVLVLVMLAGLTPLPGHALWRNAMLSAPLENLVLVLRPMLPEDFAKHLKYR